MKKILSLIGTIGIAGSGAVSSLAYIGANHNQTKTIDLSPSQSSQTQFKKVPTYPPYNSQSANTIIHFKDKYFIGTEFFGLMVTTDFVHFSEVPFMGGIDELGKRVHEFKIINNTLYVAADTGLWYTTDGKYFHNLVFDKEMSRIVTFNNLIFASGSGIGGNLFYSKDGGKTFTTVADPNVQDSKYVYVANNTLYVIAMYDEETKCKIYYSKDGVNFTESKINGALGPDTLMFYQIKSFNNMLFATGGPADNALYVSTDNGVSFNRLKTIAGVDEYLAGTLSITGNTLYYGTHKGLYWTNDGRQFQVNKSVSASDVSENQVQKINNKIYAAGPEGLYESDDQGKSFSYNTTIAPQEIIYSISQMGDYLYVSGGTAYSDPNLSSFFYKAHI